MDLLASLDETFAHTQKVIAGIRPDQLDLRTPCDKWDVRSLFAHTTGVVTNMGLGAAGQPLLADVNAVPVQGDLAAQFGAAADTTLAAWRAHGLDGNVNIGAGDMPVAVALSINLLDTGTHSWDLARATGQDPMIPDALATTILACARNVVRDDIRSIAGFDPPVEVGPDASPTTQLVAFLGRSA
jgi:uncharacterized protein (TIGR03086 family)